ncbi:MAG: FG-GAP-like repeat-containing protein [Planctomycetota bacterium]
MRNGHRTIGGWLAAMAAGAVAVAHLWLASAAMAQGGQVVQWGRESATPGSLLRFTEVACGFSHTYALRGDGSVGGWGSNIEGEINTPANLSSVTQVACGSYHTYALKGDGTLAGWGRNTFGQTNTPANLTNVIQIACGGNHTYALRGDGTLVGWGMNNYGQTNTPAGLTNVIQVACGFSYTYALKGDGTLVGWGSDGGTNTPANLTNVIQVACGGGHTYALKGDGTLVGWGDNYSGQTNTPASLTNVIQVACGGNHTYALRGDGTLVGWGLNENGQTNTPAGLNNVILVACGVIHTYALKADGTLVGWSRNNRGETTTPASLINVIQVACGGLIAGIPPVGFTYALRGDGTLVGWGDNYSGQINTPANLTNVIQVACGGDHTYALKGDGTPVGWGSNFGGGINTPANLSNATQVACGLYHTYALKHDGTLVGWGWNAMGQTNTPVGLANITQVACGDSHTYALKGDGTLVGWGDSYSGQINTPATLTNVIKVACGSDHTYALKSDGTLVGWGYNGDGQTNTPPNLTNVIQVACGGTLTVALLSPQVSDCSNPGGAGTATVKVSGSAWQEVGVWEWSNGGTIQTPGALTDVVIGESKSVGSLCDAQCATLDMAPSATLLAPIDLSLPMSVQDHSIDVGGVARLRGRLWVLASGATQLPADLSVPIVNAGSFDGTFSILQTTVPAPAGKFATLVPSSGFAGGATWSLALRDLPSALNPGEGATGTVAGSAVAAETMDLDGDGFDDLALAIDNGPLLNGTVQVLLNDGLGNLGGTTSVFADAGASGPTSIATGDADGDGRDDLVVGLSGNGTARLFLGGGSGAGSGTLTASTEYAVSGTPRSVLILPSESGGAGQVAVGSTDAGNTVSLFAAASGTASQEVPVQPQPVTMGRRGRVIATGGTTTTSVGQLLGENGALAVLSPGGAGVYSVTQTIPVPGKPVGIDVADIDRDGIADVLTSNASPQQLGTGTALGLLTLFKGTATGFGDAIPIAPSGATSGADASMVDVNADGVRDLVSVHQTLVGQSSAVAILVHQDFPGGALTLGEESVISAVRPVLCPRGDVLGPGSEGVFIVDAGTSSFTNRSLRGGESPSVAIPYRPVVPPCAGDIDGSGTVDASDLATLLNDWGTGGTASDIDGSGTVNGSDLATLLNAWGPCVQ